MLILVSGATPTVERFKGHPHLGALLTPATKNSPRRAAGWGIPWAADNAAFTGFDAPAFLRLLAGMHGLPGCLWVAAPDVVGDAAETLRRFAAWGPVIRELGFPVALVGQDGLESLPVPWDGFDAFFVGGSTEWKLGDAAKALCHEARRRGKWVHVGRVNSLRRMRACREMGADSVDGTHWTRWPDTNIPVGLGWAAEVTRQGILWEPPAKPVIED